MNFWLIGFGAGLFALAILDGLWLGVIAGGFYKEKLGGLLREKPIWSIAALFYLVHVVGVATFVLPQVSSWSGALLLGGRVTIVDLAWGTVATALTALAAWAVQRHFA